MSEEQRLETEVAAWEAVIGLSQMRVHELQDELREAQAEVLSAEKGHRVATDALARVRFRKQEAKRLAEILKRDDKAIQEVWWAHSRTDLVLVQVYDLPEENKGFVLRQKDGTSLHGAYSAILANRKDPEFFRHFQVCSREYRETLPKLPGDVSQAELERLI